MNNYVDHVVYTRCKFGYDIISGETDNRMDSSENRGGLGIYSMSSSYIQNPRDKSLHNVALRFGNGSDAGQHCFIQSFLYLTPDVGTPMLGCLRMRSQDEVTEAKNMNVIDTRYTYIGEWYMGHFGAYACDLMQADIWNAQKAPMMQYYLGSSPMPLEKPYASTAIEKSAYQLELNAFLSPERKKTIKVMLVFLLGQYDLSYEKRKTLIIRDDESNVRLWISAILHCLPVKIANQISFNTSFEWPGSENRIQYRISNKTKMYSENIDDSDVSVRSFFMLAGADPDDKGGTNPWVTLTEYPSSPYIIVDGSRDLSLTEEQLIVKLKLDERIVRRQYFSDLFSNSERINSFLEASKEMPQIPLGLSLYKYYEDYLAVTTENNPSYGAILHAFSAFQDTFKFNPKWLNDSLNRLCKDKEYLSYFDQDQNNGEKLLTLLSTYAQTIQDSEAISAINGFPIKHAIQLLSSGSADAKKYIGYLKEKKKTVYNMFLDQFIGSESMSSANIDSIRKQDPDYLNLYIEIISDYLTNNKATWSQFFTDTNNDRTLIPLMDAMVNQSLSSSNPSVSCIVKWFKSIGNDENASQQIIQFGCSRIGQDVKKHMAWWRVLFVGGVSIDTIAKKIKENTTGPEELSNFLCEIIEQNGLNDAAQRVYQEYLQDYSVFALPFYSSQIRYAKGKNNYSKTVTRLLRETSNLECNTQLVADIDSGVNLSFDDQNLEIARAVCMSGITSEKAPRSSLLYYISRISPTNEKSDEYDEKKTGLFSFGKKLFGETKTNEKQGNVNIVETYLRANSCGHIFVVPNDITLERTSAGKHFVDFMASTSKYDIFTCLIVVCSFNFLSESKLRSFLDEYSNRIVDLTEQGSISLAGIIQLKQSLTKGVQFQGKEKEMLQLLCATTESYNEILRRIQLIISSASNSLTQKRLDRVHDTLISKCQEHFPAILTEYQTLLNQAEEVYDRNNKGFRNKIMGLFGKK